MRLLADDLDGLDAPLRRQPLRPARRGRPLPWFRMGLLCAGMVAGLAYLAAPPQPEAPEPGEVPLAPLLAPPPVWQPVVRPVPLYALERIDPASFALDVRRHVGGGREDTLGFGTFGETGYGRLQATRAVTETEPAGFYVDLVRHAARGGVSVVRSTQAAPLATKLGPAEIASVTLAGANETTGASEAACLALRIAQPKLQFSLRGWVCGSAAEPPSEAQVACLVDRLTLAGEDPALGALFAESERRRAEGCQPTPPRAAARTMGVAKDADPGRGERTVQAARPPRPARPRRP
jgi:hypothetical protein